MDLYFIHHTIRMLLKKSWTYVCVCVCVCERERDIMSSICAHSFISIYSFLDPLLRGPQGLTPTDWETLGREKSAGWEAIKPSSSIYFLLALWLS